MKFCPVVPEICRGQVHGARKERIIIIIIIRNGAKTISPPNRMVIIYGPYIHINVKIYKFNHIPKYSNLIMSAILCKIRE